VLSVFFFFFSPRFYSDGLYLPFFDAEMIFFPPSVFGHLVDSFKANAFLFRPPPSLPHDRLRYKTPIWMFFEALKQQLFLFHRFPPGLI